MTCRVPFLYAAWVFLLSALGPTWSLAASSERLLAEAVQEYRAALDSQDRDQRLESFRRAELLFSQLVAGDRGGFSRPIRNADLYVNLGNAALGAERLGPAILAYRRALSLDPNHHRAEQNLEHARTLLPDWVPRPERGGLLTTFFAWVGRMSASELQKLAALTFFLTVALVACAIRRRQPMFRNLAVIPGIVWLMLLSVSLSRSLGRADDAAVVIVPETIARSADSAGAPARLPQPLPSGTEVRVVEMRDDWARVRLFDGRDAWLPQAAVELVTR
jgi:tetratricopeptide (TPR) repeat protein